MLRAQQIVGGVYAAAFARRARWAQATNHALFHLALRGMGHNGGWALTRSGEWSFISEALRGECRPLVVDVGANRGDYAAAVLAIRPRARVIAFEPNPECHNALGALAERHNGLTFYRYAVGAANGSAVLHVGEVSEWGSLAPLDKLPAYAAAAATRDVRVRMFTLDEALARVDEGSRYSVIDILKIDVEGLEPAVLEGAQELLRERPPRHIQVEINEHLLLAGWTPRRLAGLLPPTYDPYVLLPGRRGMRRVDLDRPENNVSCYANMIFRRSW